MRIACVEFETYAASVAHALDLIGADVALPRDGRIVVKPNIVNDSPHPVTTPPECVEAVIAYCRKHSRAGIAVAEGCGGLDTREAFKRLGYDVMAARLDVELIDLDRAPTARLSCGECALLPEFPMPTCLIGAYVVSVPVLKAHTMAGVTLTLKNMFGIAPAGVFGGGFYRKSKLHGRNNGELHQYVVEVNRYCAPDLSVLDATVGLADSHLGGRTCRPPVNRILAGFDPVALDAEAAGLLRVDWRSIGHIRLADGVLGRAVV